MSNLLLTLVKFIFFMKFWQGGALGVLFLLFWFLLLALVFTKQP